MKLILMGSPGAGKGTLADFLVPEYKMKYFSTGAILREEMRLQTELGIMVKNIIESGNLVPDELTVKIIENGLSSMPKESEILFDGFPRTLPQAEWLDKYLNDQGDKIDGVIQIEVDYDIVIKRLTGRRDCPSCKKGYNVYYSPPPKPETCSCGCKLRVREDDSVEVISNRLKLHSEQAKVLIDYYDKKGILYKVDGNAAKEEVFKCVVEWLNGR